MTNYSYGGPESYSYNRPTEEVRRSGAGGQVQVSESYGGYTGGYAGGYAGGQEGGYRYEGPSVTVVREEDVKRSGYGGQVQGTEGYRDDVPSVHSR